MHSPMLGAKVFFICGWLFLLAGMLTRQIIVPSVGISVHATYFVVGHFHLLLLSGLFCWVYSVLYYLGARLLGLQFDSGLVMAQLGLTAVALIGLNSMVYLRVFRSAGSSAVPSFARIGFVGLALSMMSVVLFLVIFLMAALQRFWRTPA